MIPVRRNSAAKKRAAIEGMRKLAKGMKLRGLRIKDLISEGRR